MPKGNKGAKKAPRTTLRGRDAETGVFITLEEANRRPSTTVRERVPTPGNGDTGRSKKGKK